MKNNNIQMVASDLDGTLLNRHADLSQQTIDVLIRLQESGIKLVLCTGRPLHSAQRFIDVLRLKEFDGAFIGLNGQYLHDFATNTTIEEEQLTNDDISTIFDIASSVGIFSMEVYDKGSVYLLFPQRSPLLSLGVSLAYGIRSLIHQSRNYKIKIIKSLPQGQTTAKVCFLGKPKNLKQINELIEKHPAYGSFLVNRAWLEVMKNDINKGKTLEKLAILHSISLEHIMAFGDGENDCSMMKIVGTSFATKNAMDHTKNLADEVIDYHYNDAVAKKCLEYFDLDQ
ncbi:MAG: HAD family hydrolase [Anaerorhabdus sp.]